MKAKAYKTLYEYAFKKAPDKQKVIKDFFKANIKSDNYRGLSVTRAYDKCHIRLKDKVEGFGVITQIFNYDDDVILKNTENGTMSLFEVEKKMVIYRSFRTSDGIEIFEGDHYYFVSRYDRSKTYFTQKCDAQKQLYELACNMKYYFGEEENADALVVELNKNNSITI